jgi:hypothetical protein
MACACPWSVTLTQPRESPGSGDGLSPGWRQAWARRESWQGRQGTCFEIPGRYRDITSLRRRQRPRPARLRVHPATGAGAAAGLVLGGLLTTYASWRWVFFVNVPIGILIAAAAPRVLTESPRLPGRIDWAGAVTGCGGIALLVYGLSKAATGADGISHWGDTQVLASLTASVNRRHRSPRHRSRRHRSPGLCSGLRTEPPSPWQPVLAGSASRHVITTWEKSARTTPAPRPTTVQWPRRHHAVLSRSPTTAVAYLSLQKSEVYQGCGSTPLTH